MPRRQKQRRPRLGVKHQLRAIMKMYAAGDSNPEPAD
jgi:hypothetical protein